MGSVILVGLVLGFFLKWNLDVDPLVEVELCSSDNENSSPTGTASNNSVDGDNYKREDFHMNTWNADGNIMIEMADISSKDK